ncbi:response regulator of citrate/malate metabolism [Kineococcus xinjiangensis]|uniref:Transcriptional regulatory protein n=1 Tax=Kineococcus xinjiangensis TaxID=512762 RepID=A0A2S6IGT2_9ACTN|nr:response regulator [Kineococcus xinjiangensis]PPK93422.1 response regulator of citrate/malate metabolism [Kineococcus xinjiangensis]
MSARPGGTELRVLVVEDEPLVAEAHRAFVDRVAGFRVVAVAHSAREALAALGSTAPGARSREDGSGGGRAGVDLVLLDMGLPDADGLQVLRAVRSAGVPVDVIAVTAARDLPVVRAAVSLGVVQYLLKPFTAAALRDKLLAYARFRDQVVGPPAAPPAVLDQGRIDAALAQLRPQAPEQAARGISAGTLQLVVAALREAQGGAGLSAAEVATRTGLSRESARRYLEHLVSTGQVGKVPRYGGPGRPETGYVPRTPL